MTHYPTQSDPADESAAPANGWRRFRPRTEVRGAALFFWPAVLALGCLSLALVCWGASSVLARKGSEKRLRASLLLPKLKGNQGDRKADAFHMSEPAPNALAHPKERATLAPALSPPTIDHPKVTIVEASPPEPPPFASKEPWLLMIPKVERTPPVETCHDPVVYLEPCAPQRGDSPMIRNWKLLTMYSLLTAATITAAPQPIFAQDAKDATEELKKSIDTLSKRIAALELKPADEEAITKALRAELKKLENGTLADIKKGVEQATTDGNAIQAEQKKHKKQMEDQTFLIDLLTKRVDGLEKKLLASGSAPAGPAVDKAFMDEMRGSIKSLQDTVAKLGPTKERISMSPSVGNGGAKPGRVMLANHYADELLFIVNGVGHRLPAHSTKLVENVPTGALSYEVFSTRYGVLERRATTLAGGDTFNLTAR